MIKHLLNRTPLQQLNFADFEAMLADFKGHSFMGIETCTDARLKRKGELVTYFDKDGNEIHSSQVLNDVDGLGLCNRKDNLSPVRVEREILQNPYGKGEVLKESHLRVNIGFHYANSLDNQAKREGLVHDFQIKPRIWGTRRRDCPLVDHKDKVYLECKVEELYQFRYCDIHGNEIAKEEIELFLPKRTKSSTQAPLKKEIILRDFHLQSIRKIAFGGNVFLIGD